MKIHAIRKRLNRIIGKLMRRPVRAKHHQDAQPTVMTMEIAFPPQKEEPVRLQQALTTDDERALHRLTALLDQFDAPRAQLSHLGAIERVMKTGGLKYVLGSTDAVLHKAHKQFKLIWKGDAPPSELMSLSIILEAGSLRYQRAAYAESDDATTMTIGALRPNNKVITRQTRPGLSPAEYFAKTQPLFMDTQPMAKP